MKPRSPSRSSPAPSRKPGSRKPEPRKTESRKPEPRKTESRKPESRKPEPRKPGARPGPARPPVAQRDWLSRAMSRAGVMPLAEAEALIRAGQVTVNGRPVQQPMTLVPEGAVVRVRGHKVELVRETHVLLFHKPTDCLTSNRGQRKVPTVFELLLPSLTAALGRFQWHAVGRLDKDTTGLLLFTNDERLVAHATDPDSRLSKRYVATVQGGADETKVAPLRRGLVLEDGPTRPAKVTVRDARTVEVTLTEGRHHQVKRLLGAVGLPVNALHREAIAGLELDVGLGEWRELTADEIRNQLRFTP